MWLWILLLLLLAVPAGAVTCTVTSTADSGAGSFRQAVTDANAASCDTIDFNIAGAGVHTIALASGVTLSAASVTIDGSTQSGSNRGDLWGVTTPVWNIAITGHGLTLNGAGDVLIGVDISATAAGEPAVDTGPGSSGVTIKACYLHGAANMGIRVQADSVTVGGVSPGDGNVISGNTNEGIAVLAHTGLVVQGNFICADKTGMTAAPNTIGVNLEGAASATVGGLGGAKNLISGCSAANIEAMNGPLTNPSVWPHDGVIQYNLIGTDKTGLAPIASATPANGVLFFLQNAQPTPGPATPGIDNFNVHHNTVSANAQGVVIGAASFTSINNTTVAFNNIGTDVNGAQAVGLCNLNADLLDFGTASDVHDNNLCAFTPSPTPTNTPEPHCAPVVCNNPGACDSATCFGTNNPELPFVPSDYASPSALQTAVDGVLGPGAITVGAYTNGVYCTTADLTGECPTALPTETPTATGPTPTPGITPGCCALVGAPAPTTCLDNAWFAGHPELGVSTVASLSDCQAQSVILYTGQDFVTAYNAVNCVNGTAPDHTDGRCGAAPRKHGFSGGAVINVQ